MPNVKQTFWEIISKYSIEIPTIQRDYTYGRKRASNIRVKFISDLYHSLNTSSKATLHLDFVYGRLQGLENYEMLSRNKQSINTLLESLKSYASNIHIDVAFSTKEKQTKSSDIVTFIPLDGQQRLTTLFLLHWYIAKKTKNDRAIQTLGKFTYATRNSSKAFIKMLMEYKTDAINSFSITNSELFFSFWKNDPTVKSMLAVIDEIDAKFKAENHYDVWNKLTNEKQITFDFFDLDAFDQTDELYVKMNARGKKLSNFENFKAWLLKTYASQVLINDWKKKLDIQWHDLFWNANSNTTTEIDNQYLQYFKNAFLSSYLLSFKDNNDIKGKNFDLITKYSDESPIALFEDNKDLIGNNISYYLQFLDCIHSHVEVFKTVKTNFNYLKINLIDFIFKANENYNWWEATFFYAIFKYSITYPQNLEENLQDWLRICANLIFNTAIDAPLRYKEACESINSIVASCQDNPVQCFSKLKETDITFFASKQVKEEIQKAQLITANNQWKEELIKYENHFYFYGQIGFILDLNKEKSIGLFKSNAEKLAALFSKDNFKEIHLLNRLFLSYEECFVQRGSNLMFYSNDYGTVRVRNENWRLVFSKHTDIIKDILTLSSFEKKDIENVIDTNLERKTSSAALKELIKTPDLFTYMRKRCLRKYGASFLLLSTTRIYGYHVELFTYTHYLKNKETTTYEYGNNAVELPKYIDKANNIKHQYDIDKNKIISLPIKNITNANQ